MLIKFTSGGRGGGGAVCSYLVDAERQGREHCPPEVVRGDLARTQELIDSIGRQWTYTHGVLSFAPEDAPTVIEQEAAMDAVKRSGMEGGSTWNMTLMVATLEATAERRTVVADAMRS